MAHWRSTLLALTVICSAVAAQERRPDDALIKQREKAREEYEREQSRKVQEISQKIKQESQRLMAEAEVKSKRWEWKRKWIQWPLGVVAFVVGSSLFGYLSSRSISERTRHAIEVAVILLFVALYFGLSTVVDHWVPMSVIESETGSLLFVVCVGAVVALVVGGAAAVVHTFPALRDIPSASPPPPATASTTSGSTAGATRACASCGGTGGTTSACTTCAGTGRVGHR